MIKKFVVAVNEGNRRIGEDHPKSKLLDHEIDMLFELRAEGFGYKRLAVMFEISPSAVRSILKGRTRGQTVHTWRAVSVGESDSQGCT